MANDDCSIVFADKPTNVRFIDLTGRVFTRLTVLGLVSWKTWGNGSRTAQWLCKCECGTVKTVSSPGLKSGGTTSCGCRIREVTSKRVTTHGLRKNKSNGSPELRSYQGAKQRCENVKSKHYKGYGERGIEFRFKSFDEFIECMGNKPHKNCTIDRIDNEGHYEVGNVRWATPKVQANNRRSTIYVTVDGVTRGLSEWIQDAKKCSAARYQIQIRKKNAEEVVKCLLVKN